MSKPVIGHVSLWLSKTSANHCALVCDSSIFVHGTVAEIRGLANELLNEADRIEALMGPK